MSCRVTLVNRLLIMSAGMTESTHSRGTLVGLGVTGRSADLRIEAAVADIEDALSTIEQLFPEMGVRLRANIAARLQKAAFPPIQDTIQPTKVSRIENGNTQPQETIAYGKLYGVISNDICGYLSDEPNGLSVEDLHQFIEISGIEIKRHTLVKYLRRMAETDLIRTRTRGLYVLNQGTHVDPQTS